MVYFGILVSPCNRGRLEVPNARLMVVEDHELGTNDCRGWLRRSLFQKLQQRYTELVGMEKAALLTKRKEPNNFTPEQFAVLVEQAERNARTNPLFSRAADCGRNCGHRG